MTNSNRTILTLALALLSQALASTLHASTVISAPSGGVAYNSCLSLGGTDTGAVSGAVGQWSWQDPAVADANVPSGGWGHTSNWIAITLTEASVLHLTLGRDAAVPQIPSGFYPVDNYYPSFTLWQNWDTDAAPLDFYDASMAGTSGNYHVYPNTANVGWAEDLSYLDHYRNSGAEISVTDSWILPAGNYTFAVGGLAASSVGASRQGYQASFSTNPIPEPGNLAFLALTGLTALRRRRR